MCIVGKSSRIYLAYQHSGSEVKFVKELGDEDVRLHKVLLVSFLNITDDFREPLPLLLSTGHPDEEDLQRAIDTQ